MRPASAAPMASRCSVLSVNTSTLWPCSKAFAISSAIAAVRLVSLAMCLNTSWMPASAGSSTRATKVRGITSNVCGAPAGVNAVCRVGPHCMKMIGCRPSRRIGVAVSPSTYLALARFMRASNENAER
jgi:hypothetical protein